MKYNIEQLITKGGTDKRKKFIFFWGNQPDKSGQISASCFSQWWLSRFEEEGLFYYSSEQYMICLLYTSPSPRDRTRSRMPSSA